MSSSSSDSSAMTSLKPDNSRDGSLGRVERTVPGRCRGGVGRWISSISPPLSPSTEDEAISIAAGAAGWTTKVVMGATSSMSLSSELSSETGAARRLRAMAASRSASPSGSELMGGATAVDLVVGMSRALCSSACCRSASSSSERRSATRTTSFSLPSAEDDSISNNGGASAARGAAKTCG